MTNRDHIFLALNWLKRAQDTTNQGGVSAWYSLVSGWSHSYIETTGYIINTFLDCARIYGSTDLQNRAAHMGDFLLTQEVAGGGFRTAVAEQQDPSPPTVFNTGQDLLGLTSLYEVTHENKYRDAAVRAADFLCEIQEPDGSWLKNTYGSTKHTYHTRVAWGLLRVYEITGIEKYKDSACKNLDWALVNQLPNGWYAVNHLPPPNSVVPFTHTISYAIEGFWWSSLILNSKPYAMSALKGAIPPLNYFLKYNKLPGTFDSQWQSKDVYSCLTGDAQLSLMWWQMYHLTGKQYFKEAGTKMNRYLKSKQVTKSLVPQTIGGMAGSDPLWGDLLANRGYCRLAYINWATKFFIDALLAEEMYA